MPKSLRITIVQGAFLPVPPLWGGAIEKMWFALGQYFAAQGHQVTHVSRKIPSLPAQEVIGGVRHLRVPGYDTPRNALWLKCLDGLYSWRVKRLLPKADILISNTFWLPLLAKQEDSGKIMVDVQRMPKGQMRLYRRVSRLRANSRAVAEAISRQDPKARERVVVIPNPLHFVPESKPDGARKEKILLYAGRLHPEKGIEILLQSFARLCEEGLADWRLALVGPVATSQGGGGEAWWKRLQERLPLPPERMTWPGPVFAPDELNAWYQRATVFVYPSLAEKGETFGLAPLEAMSWGAVPVVSDLACFRDFISAGQNGFVFAHRVDPVGQLIQTLRPVLARDDLSALAESAMEVRQTHALARIGDVFLEEFRRMRKESN